MWIGRAVRLSGWVLAILAVTYGIAAAPAMADKIKIAVIKFGTVSWETDVIKTHGLDKERGIDLEILPLANKNATTVALQAGEADMVVTDWLWVSRQRAEGEAYTFAPYSTALGALMVPADSPIRGLADLKGKRVGIAGGPLDKSWLLMRGLALERMDLDLDKEVDKVFAAAPLLNEQILAGRLDAVINFWHFAARLEAAGLRRVMGVSEVARSFGVENEVPLIGYVFDADWAASRRDAVLGLLEATRAAKQILLESDAEWERLRPLMRAKDDATFKALREGYRAGVPKAWGEAEQADAAKLFSILAKYGGRKLVGSSTELQTGTFWPEFAF